MNDEVLNLETRRRIYKTIEKQPGICIRELERTLRMAMGLLTYHLSVLLKKKVIEEDSDAYFRRFFIYGIEEKEKKMITLMRRDAVRRVIPLLLAFDRVNNRIISERLGVSPSTASWHVKRLKANDLIDEVKEGNKVFYYLRDRDVVKKIYLV